MTKRNKLLDITEANQILLFNSNHCKFLRKNLIATQARASTQELSTPLNLQQLRIVARSQQKIRQVLLRKTLNYKIRSTHMQCMLSNLLNKNVVLPSEQQNPQLFQQLNNSLFPQNHNQFPNKTALQFSPLPTQSYTQKQTNEQPVSQLRSQPTVLPNNLQIYQSKTAPNFPASSMPFGANVPNFVDSETQSNAKQNPIYPQTMSQEI